MTKPKPKILPETRQAFDSSNSSDLITFEKETLISAKMLSILRANLKKNISRELIMLKRTKVVHKPIHKK